MSCHDGGYRKFGLELIYFLKVEKERHTLEELLAGIFLEKCLVAHRTVEVVNHQPENRGDVLLGVTRIVSESSILVNTC